MRGRKLWLVVLVGMLAALAPTAVFAAVTQQFTASGEIKQTFEGTQAVEALGNASAPGGLVAALEAMIPSETPSDTPGVETSGQAFSGSLGESRWGAIKNSDVTITHNSWLTTDILGLLNGEEVDLAGIAWGTFTINKGNGNRLTGSYGALITGSLQINNECAPNFDVSDLVGSELVLPVEVVVVASNAGTWGIVPGTARGAFGQIDDGGPISFGAKGCLGEEKGNLEVAGSRLGGQ